MPSALDQLTEREKQTLRLIVRGHDAKSAARDLGISVNTVNERLREARRKLAVSSSREAARRLLAHEGDAPDLSADKPLREAAPPAIAPDLTVPAIGRGRSGGAARFAIGGLFMSLALALVALTVSPQTAPAPSAAAAQADDLAIEAAARSWLALLDQGRWAESWAQTGSPFRMLNTSAAWAAASVKNRAPLGVLRTRTLIAHEDLPAPPHGYFVVKFRTDFANRSGVVETVALDQEDGGWRVVGIYLG